MYKKALSGTVYVALIAVLSFIIVYKSIYLPFTFDEMVTWERYTNNAGIKDILLNTDGSSNNHILNSISIKVCQLVFSDKPWTLRLPNVISFFLFAAAMFVAAKKYFGSPPVLFCLPFICMFLNPYLIDFFSLARGYGMANAFMACSVVCLLLFSSSEKMKWYYLAILFATLAAYANFTFLIYWIAVHILLSAILLQQKHPKAFVSKVFAETSFLLLVFVALCYTPLANIQRCVQTTFGDSTGFYHDTILTGTNRFVYGNPLFGLSDKVISYAVILTGLAAGINFFLKIKKNPSSAFTDPFNLMFLLLAFVCAANMLQVYIFKTSYLSGRTALIYYVLFMFVFIFLIRDMAGKNLLAAQLSSGFISLMLIFHFALAVNLKSAYEWSFDAYTYDVMNHIKAYRQQHPETKTIELNLTNFLHPSFSFYQQTNKLPWFILYNPQDTGVDSNSNALFYYTTSDHLSALKNYAVVKRYKPNGILLPDAPAGSEQVLLIYK